MILVAGGTGMLGREVVARLVAARHEVRVLTRDAGRAEGLAAEVTVGDIRDAGSLLTATRGCTTVISALHGFLGGRGAGPEEIDDRGNERLVRAATDSGVAHFVLLSVFGARPDHPMALHRAKYAAEQHLRSSGLSWTVLRPTSYVETWIPLVGGKLASGGPAMVLGRGDNPINFISVADAATFVTMAATDPGLRGSTVDVVGSDNLTMTELARRLGATRIRRVPRSVLRTASVVLAPVAPAGARAARAAVVMDTTDMAADPSEIRAEFPEVTWHAAGDVAADWTRAGVAAGRTPR